MGRGKDFENELTNKLDRAVGNHVNVYPVGYSGSHATSAEDILVTDASTGLNYALEVKNYTTKERCYIEPDQLEALVDRNNGQTVCALVMKFSRREALVVRYFDELTGGQMQVDGAEAYNDASVAEKFAALIPDAFRPKVTDSGNLRLVKPDTDDWPSATSGVSDEDAVLSGLGITTQKSVEVA